MIRSAAFDSLKSFLDISLFWRGKKKIADCEFNMWAKTINEQSSLRALKKTKKLKKQEVKFQARVWQGIWQWLLYSIYWPDFFNTQYLGQ